MKKRIKLAALIKNYLFSFHISKKKMEANLINSPSYFIKKFAQVNNCLKQNKNTSFSSMNSFNTESSIEELNSKTRKIRIGTFNIRNVTDHYEKRLPLILKEIEKMNCDFLGLQEVNFLNTKNQLKDLNPYNKYLTFPVTTQMNLNLSRKESPDKEFNIDGNAVLIKEDYLNSISYFENLKNEEVSKYHKILNLSPFRVAQMITTEIKIEENKSLKVNFVNTHLHSTINEELIRTHEMRNIIFWIENNTTENDLTIIVGDFNTLPDTATYKRVIESGFVSLHKEHHFNEPEKTFHTKMEAPFKDDDPEGTFDYIL